jgi:hypothetical protein
LSGPRTATPPEVAEVPGEAVSGRDAARLAGDVPLERLLSALQARPRAILTRVYRAPALLGAAAGGLAHDFLDLTVAGPLRRSRAVAREAAAVRQRVRLHGVIEIAGLTLIVAGVWMVWVPAAFVAAGAGAVLWAQGRADAGERSGGG